MKVRGQTVHSPKERISRLCAVDQKTGCWEWQSTLRRGYGSLTTGSRTDGTRRTVRAHRFAFETFIGPIPDGMEVCHRCDNRKCCNPEHLFIGTRQDNIDDREAKGRNKPPRGETTGTARLTEAQVIAAREMRAAGVTFIAIARHFGVGKKTALQAVKGETWAHIPFPPPPPTKEASQP